MFAVGVESWRNRARDFGQPQQAGGGSLVSSMGRWWLQNLWGYLLCVCEGVRAVRRVLCITGAFSVRAWEEPVVAEHVVPMTSGMAGGTLWELILATAESLCL